MSTAVLSNGECYYIPQSDLSFFTELAERMKWRVIGTAEDVADPSPVKSWVGEFAGKWQDERSTAQIVEDIHSARTTNPEVSL